MTAPLGRSSLPPGWKTWREKHVLGRHPRSASEIEWMAQPGPREAATHSLPHDTSFLYQQRPLTGGGHLNGLVGKLPMKVDAPGLKTEIDRAVT